MAFEDADFIKLNLPDGVSFAINGLTMSLDEVITAALDEAGSREGALAMLFTMLESDHLQSETLGKYSYTRWGMRGSDYWRLQASSAAISNNPPNVQLRPPVEMRRVWP